MNNTVLTEDQIAALKAAIVSGLQEAFDAASIKSKEEIGYQMNDLRDGCFRIGLSEEFQELTCR